MKKSTSQKIRLKGGPRPFGHSFYAAFWYCQSKWARTYLGGRKPPPSVPMLIGTSVHEAMQHHATILQGRAQGLDTSHLMSPMEAAMAGASGKEGMEPGGYPWEEQERVANVVTAATNSFGNDFAAYDIVAVETVDPVECGTLECEGHPDHGKPILYEPRRDLVVMEKRTGLIYDVDYKTSSKLTSESEDSYKRDMQFHGMRAIGEHLHGEKFGGVLLYLIETRPPYRTKMVRLPRYPGVTRGFFARIYWTRHQQADIERALMYGELDLDCIPGVFSEQSGCRTKYPDADGLYDCPFLVECLFGRP